jgi:predicted porin
MKKTLIALAALAVSGAAFAQSSVTISGTFDPSYSRVQTTTAAGAKTSVNSLANSQQGTSGINFIGTEDLGGGLKAYFRYEANFDATEGGAAAAGQTSGLTAGEVFAGLQGGFGSIQLGRANSHTLAVQGARTPFGTKVGGGFGTVSGTSNVRNNDSIKFTSPKFGGLTVGATHGLKTTTAAAWNEVGVFYGAGNLNIGLSNVNQKNTLSQTNLSASYNLGVAVVMAGMHSQDNKSGAANAKSKGYNLAVRVPMGAVTLLANVGDLDVSGGAAGDRDITAIGAQYALSKRTSAYARLVNDKTNAGSKINTTLLGLQHNF